MIFLLKCLAPPLGGCPLAWIPLVQVGLAFSARFESTLVYRSFDLPACLKKKMKKSCMRFLKRIEIEKKKEEELIEGPVAMAS